MEFFIIMKTNFRMIFKLTIFLFLIVFTPLVMCTNNNATIEKSTKVEKNIKYINFIKKHNKDLTDEEIDTIINSIEKYFIYYDINLMYSIITIESEFDPNANSYLGNKYGRGICQVSDIALEDYNLKHWSSDYISKKDIYDIETNIKVGSWIFYYNINYGIDTLNKQIIAYNEGHISAKNKKSSKYLIKVLNIYKYLDCNIN